MSIVFNSTAVKKVVFNDVTIKKVIFNDTVVYRNSCTVSWHCYRYYPGAGSPRHYVTVTIPEGTLTGSDQITVELYGGYHTPLIETKYLTASTNSVKLGYDLASYSWEYGYSYYLKLTSPSGATTQIDMPSSTGTSGTDGSTTIEL